MNKKIRCILGVISIPMGAILLNACGPVEGVDTKGLTLSENSDKWIFWDGHVSEYGGCYNGWDDNGNGLKDSEDPDCHVYLGPLRDLSLAPYPIGHNFLPDISKIPYGGPGWNGWYDNREQYSRWFRFLTDLNGDIEGLDLFTRGADPSVTPIPEPLPERVFQGTFAQGNNNNVSPGAMHALFMDHSLIAPLAIAPAPVPVDGMLVDGVLPAVGAIGTDIGMAVGATGGYGAEGGALGAVGAVGADRDASARYGYQGQQTKNGNNNFGNNWRGNYKGAQGQNSQYNQYNSKAAGNRHVDR